jgi:hypothetical protein
MSTQFPRVALPEENELARVGKVRSGESVDTGRTTDWGDAITRPQKIDYWRVFAEESGITSPEAVAAFHEVYGDKPKELRIILPGHDIADVLVGAWRLYGKNEVKRVCNRDPRLADDQADENAICSNRRTAGGFEHGVPCICQKQGLVGEQKGCKLRYTLRFMMPDLPLVGAWGIWEWDTGSVISIRNLMRVLQTVRMVRGGSLLWAEFVLGLKPVKVHPEGLAQTSTVYVADPRPVEAPASSEIRPGSLRWLMANQQKVIAAAGPAPMLPAPAIDDEPDDLLDDANLDGAAEAAADAARVAATGNERLAERAWALQEEYEKLEQSIQKRFNDWCKAEGLLNFDQIAERLGDQSFAELLASLPATPPAVDPVVAGTGEASPAATTTPTPVVVPPDTPAAPQPAAGARVPSYSKANPTVDDVKAWMAGLTPGKTLALAAVCSNMGIRPLPVEILDKFGPDDVGDVFAALEEPPAPAAADPAAARAFINGIHDQVGLPSPDQGTLA